MTAPRTDRLQLRVSPQQRELIVAAAESRDQTVTDYVVSHVVEAAKQDLADRRLFAIDAAAWAEFNAFLTRPPVHKPALDKLLSKPEPWVD